MAKKSNVPDSFVPDEYNDAAPQFDIEQSIIDELSNMPEPNQQKASKVMPKKSLPLFMKTAQLVDHILELQTITLVPNAFGGNSFYLTCYDETLGKTVVMTGGSAALQAQLAGADVEGMRVVLRQRGQSYEFVDADGL